MQVRRGIPQCRIGIELGVNIKPAVAPGRKTVPKRSWQGNEKALGAMPPE